MKRLSVLSGINKIVTGEAEEKRYPQRIRDEYLISLKELMGGQER
jgi:hypothetical protein